MEQSQTRDERVNAEYARLKELFKDIPDKKLKLADGLIIQAARLRVNLDDNWADICEKGDYEHFSQSEKLDPYERERPVAKLYNSRDQAYQKVIRQLTYLLPEDKQREYDETDLI